MHVGFKGFKISVRALKHKLNRDMQGSQPRQCRCGALPQPCRNDVRRFVLPCSFSHSIPLHILFAWMLVTVSFPCLSTQCHHPYHSIATEEPAGEVDAPSGDKPSPLSISGSNPVQAIWRSLALGGPVRYHSCHIVIPAHPIEAIVS